MNFANSSRRLTTESLSAGIDFLAVDEHRKGRFQLAVPQFVKHYGLGWISLPDVRFAVEYCGSQIG